MSPRIRLLVAALLLASCGPAGPDPVDPITETAPSALRVVAVNYPLAFVAERIGGDRVRVELPVPPDIDPATWQPDRSAISSIQGAERILLNGAGYARWVGTAALPSAALVDTAAQIRDRLIWIEDAAIHSHGPEGEHSHGELAATLWLDLDLLAAQARAVERSFSSARPDWAAEFSAAIEQLDLDLARLSDRIQAAARALQGEGVAYSHPVYQYLVRRYGLEGPSVHWEPDQPLGDSELAELKAAMAGGALRWMIWEGEPLAESIAALERIGVRSLTFDPCGNRPASGDFWTVMEANVGELERAASGR